MTIDYVSVIAILLYILYIFRLCNLILLGRLENPCRFLSQMRI